MKINITNLNCQVVMPQTEELALWHSQWQIAENRSVGDFPWSCQKGLSFATPRPLGLTYDRKSFEKF